MQITLFMAISINGYVAGPNDDTDWIKDTEILYKVIAEKGVCVLGRRTYDECVKYNAFPYKNALNVVMTHEEKLIAQSTEQAIFTSKSPAEVIKMVEEKGHQEAILVGGGNTNSQFLAAGLIDEVIIDVHPMILENGIKLFEETFPRTQLSLVESKLVADNIVQNRYKVLK